MFPDLTRDDVLRLETARLWLRWPRLADREAILRLAGVKAVAEMTSSIPHPYPPGAAEQFVFAARKANCLGEALHLVITRKGRDEAIGVVSLNPAPDGDLVLGFWLGEAFWGQGYCSEAVGAAIEAGFSLTATAAVVANVRVVNPASRRVLEKLGFSHAGARLMAFPARGGAFAADRFVRERQTATRPREARVPPAQMSGSIPVAALRLKSALPLRVKPAPVRRGDAVVPA